MISPAESIHITLETKIAAGVAVGSEFVFSVSVQTVSGQEIRGALIEVVSAEGGQAIQASCLGVKRDQNCETEQFSVRAPSTVGRHEWLICFPAQEIDGRQYGESTCQFSFETRPQRTSLAVWGVPSTVQAGARFRVKIGAKSAGGWDVSGSRIAVLDEAGTVVSSGTLSEELWAGTTLNWRELELTAPETEGVVRWEATFPATEMDVPHEGSSARFGFAAIRAPNTRFSVRVAEEGSSTPMVDAKVGLGVHQGTTDESGLALLEVPDGEYRLTVWKAGYEPARQQVDLTHDRDIEVVLVPQPEDKEPWERSY